MKRGSIREIITRRTTERMRLAEMVDELDLERRLRCRIGHLEAYSITNKLKYLKKSTDAFDLDFCGRIEFGIQRTFGCN